jgi:hypothetical protein
MWKTAEDAAIEQCTPSYATLEDLREHWAFVFSERAFEDTELYTSKASEYEAALAASVAAATSENPGHLITLDSGARAYDIGDLPPLIPLLANDLPDGSVRVPAAAAAAAAAAAVPMEE